MKEPEITVVESHDDWAEIHINDKKVHSLTCPHEHRDHYLEDFKLIFKLGLNYNDYESRKKQAEMTANFVDYLQAVGEQNKAKSRLIEHLREENELLREKLKEVVAEMHSMGYVTNY